MTVVLETERLILREWTTASADIAAAFAIYGDPEVTRFLADGARVPNLTVMRQLLDSLIADYAERPGLGYWAVVERASGEMIGTGLLAPLENDGEIEVGYHLARRAWGHGYATEIARALIAYGFTRLDLPRIVGRAYTANHASLHVLEKAGMHFTGHQQLGGSDLAYYAIERPQGQNKGGR